MTLQEFTPIFAELAVQLRATDADEITIRSYHKMLQKCELPFVKMAAERLAAESEWFPKTSEWLVMIAKVESERLEHQRKLLRDARGHLCSICDDTTWEQTPTGVKRCRCAVIRRAEVLGIRPWPELPAATGGDTTQLARVEEMASKAVKGF